MKNKVMLTGDRPTGDLHIGHFVGSIKERIKKQETHDCYILIANVHTLTTKTDVEDLEKARDSVIKLAASYLACGIDPAKTKICVQSDIEAVYKINTILGMLTPFNRVSGLPSIKEMSTNASIKEISVGLYNYPVLQSADILCFGANAVPVGKDNEAHLELTRFIAKKFNRLYGDTFVVPEMDLYTPKTLLGTDGKGKMSKSANNCIYLTDEDEAIKKKVMSMYTDKNRVRADIPGKVEGNPVFQYLYEFDEDVEVVDSMAERYRKGTIGDVEVKKRLYTVLQKFIAPIRAKYKELMKTPKYIHEVLKEGRVASNAISSNIAYKVMDRIKCNTMYDA